MSAPEPTQNGAKGRCVLSIVAKYLGQTGFTMIQTAYQVHQKLSASLLQQNHSREPSHLTPASDQNTHTRATGRHYNASHP